MPQDYNIGSGMSERQLQLSTFWVRRRLLLRNLGYGTLVAIGALSWGWVLWGLVDAYIISYPRESRITRLIAQNQVTLNSLTATAPQQVQSSTPLILASTDNRSDILVELTNPNPQWWAEFTYRFEVDGTVTPERKGYLLPQDRRYVTELGWRTGGRARNATLQVDNVRWHRVDPSIVGNDYSAYREERVQMSFTDVTFRRDLTVGTQNISQTSFVLENPSGFGFWEVELTVILYRGSTPVAMNTIKEREIKPGEKRPITVQWYENLSGVTKTDIRPSVNILDPSVYLPTERFE